MLPLLAGIVLAQASPGPNMMAVASSALGSGRAAGLLTSAGISTGVLVWALLFAFGAAALLEAFPGLLTVMKLLGGGYLLYLALRSVRGMMRTGPAVAVTGANRSGVSAYLTGLAVVMTNPKAALMWVAIALFLAASGVPSEGFLATGLFAAGSAFIIYGAYAVIFSTGLVVRVYGRLSRWIEGLFAAVFGALGARLAAEGLGELRG